MEWYIDDESGELIVCVAGELHLERCLKDLEERFAKGCEVTVKEPVIPFREGLADDKINTMNQEESDSEDNEDELVDLEFEISPLPKELTEFLVNHEVSISEIVNNKHENDDFKNEFVDKFAAVIDSSELVSNFPDAKSFIEGIVSFGPKRVGPNIFC